MSLYSQWTGIAEMERTPEENNTFWKEYFDIETQAYKKILARKEDFYDDKLSVLAEEFDMTSVVFAGFMDGINSSLAVECDLDKLKESSKVSLKLDFDKLYYNMLEAKAKWLYTLDEWDAIFTEEERKIIRQRWKADKQAVSHKVGRNETCPCGSGKKYKKCCGQNK
jgi:preprotein translocase subunit SecA